jgi:hypothetical protein
MTEHEINVHMIHSISFIQITGERVNDELVVDDRTLEDWPKSIRIGDLHFEFEEEETNPYDNNVLGCYSQQKPPE